MKNLFQFIVLWALSVSCVMAQEIPSYISSIDNQTLQGWWPMEGNATNQLNLDTASAVIASSDIDRLGEEGAAYNYYTANQSNGQRIVLPSTTGNFNGTGLGLTVNLWVQLNLDPDSSGVIAEAGSVTSEGVLASGWRLQLFGGDSLRGIYKFNDTNYLSVEVSTDLYSSQVLTGHSDWHMITFTKDDTEAHLFVDGVLVGSSPWIGTPQLVPVAYSLYLGSSSADVGEFQYLGKIDDIAIWERLLSSTEVSSLFNESPSAIAGCTNSNACNFLSNMTVNDGTCSFLCQGCMDPCACNYNQNVTVHLAESCEYDCIVDTVVLQAFLDLNINGVKDADEEIIINRPIRYTGVDSATVYTNNLGEFILPVRAGNYAFEIYSFPTWIGTIANASTPLFQDALFPNAGADTLKFGLAPAPTVDTSATAQIVSGNWDSYSCSSGYGSGLYVVNTGGTILSGLMTLTCDGVFTPGPDSSLTIGPDSISAGYAEWYIENLMPGESGLYTFHVDGNVSEASSLDFNMHIELNSPSVQGIYIDDFTITPAIDCSPQPAGEITATPIGIQPGNYIEAGETITYLVQFRNMGPGEVDSLRMSINLNSNEFELATLNILYASEALEGCLHDDGTIDLFLRDGYVIPDTLTDPIAALGYLVFEVQVKTDVEPGSTITVAPYLSMEETTIYVEPFVHRIFDCTDFFGLDDLLVDNPYYVVIDPLIETAIELSVCEDETNSLYALDYSWQIDNAEIGDSCAISIETTDPNILDTLSLTLIISNPALGCLPDTTIIPITIIIPVEEFDASHNIQAYPNPFENRCTVVFTEKFNTIVLYNSLGELIRSWSNQPSSIEIDHNQLSSGAYYLVAHSEQRTARKILIAE
jgi:hypothetical protein